MKRSDAVAMLALVLTLSGCAVGTPMGARESSARPAIVGQRAPEGADRRAGRPVSSLAGDGRIEGSPELAVHAFASAYINWSWADVAGRLDALARSSVGQARSELELEAGETRNDRTLRRNHIGNVGAVETVASLTGRPQTFVVVTREQTTSTSGSYAGLIPAWHVALASVTVARVSLSGGGSRDEWVVDDWQPET